MKPLFVSSDNFDFTYKHVQLCKLDDVYEYYQQFEG